MKIVSGLKSVGGLWLVQVVKMVLSVAVSVVTIRYLGPEQYGILGIAAANVVLFSALAGLPPGSIVVREMAAHATKGGEAGMATVLSTAVVLRSVGYFLQLVLTSISLVLIAHGGDVAMATLLITLAHMNAPFTVISSTFEFDGRFDRVAQIELTTSIVSVCVRFGLVAMSAPLLWFAAVGLVDCMIMICMYLMTNTRKGLIRLPSFSAALSWRMLNDSWPLVLTGMAMAIYTRTDVLLISQILGMKEAGWYTAAVRMTEVLNVFPGVIASVYFPTLARRHNDDRDGYYRLVTNSCGVTFWFGAAIALGLTVAGPTLFGVLLGEKFAPSIPVVQIIAWSIAIVALSTAFGSCLTIEHATRVPLYTTLLGAVVNVVLLYLLIPRLGIVGAALSTLIAQIVSLFATFLFYRDARLFAALAAAMSPTFLVTMAGEVRAMAGKRGG